MSKSGAVARFMPSIAAGNDKADTSSSAVSFATQALRRARFDRFHMAFLTGSEAVKGRRRHASDPRAKNRCEERQHDTTWQKRCRKVGRL